MSPDVVINGLTVEVIESNTDAAVVINHPQTVVDVDVGGGFIDVGEPGVSVVVEPQKEFVVLHQGAPGKAGTLILDALTSDPENPQVGQIWIRIDL